MKARGFASNRLDHPLRSEGSRFGCVRRNIFQDRSKLRCHQVRVDRDDGAHAPGVLHSEQRDHRFAVNIMLMERFEVGLNTGSAAGVGTGDRECNGCQNVSRLVDAGPPEFVSCTCTPPSFEVSPEPGMERRTWKIPPRFELVHHGPNLSATGTLIGIFGSGWPDFIDESKAHFIE